ncbi:MAG: aldolase [Oscillospiraceae bacterium]|nr:aldolase [Oscillospiraceae bacterium]
MLKLMYITNQPEVAQIAEAAGVDRIFVDMEFIGKDARQKDLDTVKCHHTVQDVVNVKRAVTKAEVLVRVNPIHDALSDYPPSEEEINAVLAAGADVIMLPFFKTAEEVRSFVRLVNGRTKTMLLLETPEAVECIDEILTVEGVDEVHIGLNDLSLGYGMSFMFELLADGTVERLCLKLRKKGVSYGFGGIATIGRGMLPSEYIIKEHYRLGSTCAILSRSFCDATKIQDLDEIKATFLNGVREIRALERECEQHSKFFFENERDVVRLVDRICKGMSDGNK